MGVPQIVFKRPSPSFPAAKVAKPKSATFKLKSASNKRFCAFKSRWTIPCL